MGKIKTLLLLVVLVTANIGKVYSQQDSIAKYLDDKGLSSYKRIIKTDLSQILQGNWMFIVEQDITGNFRMEVGAGLLTAFIYKPFRKSLYHDGTEVNKNKLESVSMKPGISLYVSPRLTSISSPSYYLSANLLSDYYFKQLLVNELTLTIGKEINLSNKFVLDINAGFGVDAHWSFDGYYFSHKKMLFNGRSLSHHNTISLMFPINVKLGYRLK
jgi:hypothetical protein